MRDMILMTLKYWVLQCGIYLSVKHGDWDLCTAVLNHKFVSPLISGIITELSLLT